MKSKLESRIEILAKRLKRLAEIDPGEKRSTWLRLTMACSFELRMALKDLDNAERPIAGFLSHIEEVVAMPASSIDQDQNYSSFGDDDQSARSGSRVFGIPPTAEWVRSMMHATDSITHHKVYSDDGKLNMNALAKSIEHSLASIKEEE